MMKRIVGIFRNWAAAGILVAGVSAFAQNYGGGGFGGRTGGGFGRGGGRGGFSLNSNTIRQSLLGRVQTEVGFTDEEWSVIEPKLWKVVGLQAQTGEGSLGQLVTRARGGRTGGTDVNSLISEAINGGNPLPVLQLQQDLESMLADPNTPLNLIEAKLQQYRTVMGQAKAELAASQEDLRSVLTLRQEALLMEMGYLE